MDNALWVSMDVRAFGEVVTGQASVRTSIESEHAFQTYKEVRGNKEVAVRHPHPNMDEDTWAKLCDMFANPKYEEIFPSVTSEIGPAELYATSHKQKNEDWLSDVAKDNHMRELQEQAISDGRSNTDIDILHQVLCPKPSYVRELGRAVKPPRTSGSSSTSVARQLREAQLEIDRLKAEWEAEVEQMRIEREAEIGVHVS
ncbi:hypothetical protein CJ030_MR5G025389 [Morella rubra]|uniref:Uncharacterized protein n=1 Tax=Morella rubra TaxID=262757 RepID=A0A6A1VH78_9ROSI|nr:hypothetical protein CJ030_MR5G025389 [Morella rubra]